MSYTKPSSVLEKANLSNSHFMKLIRYANADLGYKVNHIRIEIGFQVLEESGLEWPSIKYIPNKKHIKEYEKNKKKSDRLDKKFTTAYKRALKKAKLI